MIDPRHTVVLIRPQSGAPYQDKTPVTHSWEFTAGGFKISLNLRGGSKEYNYSEPGRVLVLQDPVSIPLPKGRILEVDGHPVSHVSEMLHFDHMDGAWTRLFTVSAHGESYITVPKHTVRWVKDAAMQPRAAKIMKYWRNLVENLPDLDGRRNPLRYSYETVKVVHPQSALARYLSAAPITEIADPHFPIYPFSSNISQREALANSLRYPISVIDGPPGTGKTQTILNILATLSASPGARIGVVSASNAAVDNVQEKLEKLGFGYIVARLGRKEVKEEFFASQTSRNELVRELLSTSTVEATEIDLPTEERLSEIEEKISQLQDDERTLANLRQELTGHRLEFHHFMRYLEGHQVTNLDGVELIRLGSDRILDYLIETHMDSDQQSRPLMWVTRLRRLMRYGRLKEVDPTDSSAVLSLQRAYYVQRIEELEESVLQLEDRLARADLSGMVECQRAMSLEFFRNGLSTRYRGLNPGIYQQRNYTRQFDEFSTDYPIILSTCHSLRQSIGPDNLLDFIIVDESSQVDLLSAGLVLASAKRVIVVGDLLQLPHIPETTAIEKAMDAPFSAYDYAAHNLLSSLQEVYGNRLPRTMLREHYRCNPEIINFCNEKFYRNQLIPFTTGASTHRPLVLHTTVEGNHMRDHREGGKSNEREIDVIQKEVVPLHCAHMPPDDIGVVSPYRRQVDKMNKIFLTDLVDMKANTVHKFQGREKRAIIMSTVLDETWRGQRGMKFTDDPRLVNVAVSRAQEKFILVTNYDMLPKSRNLRDLMEYVRYHDPESQPHRSSIVSVFDLLYRSYSQRLISFASRQRGEMKYFSEDIIWTLLQEILAEDAYRDLEAIPQVLVQNLIPTLDGLTSQEARYVKNRCSVDFVVHRRVTRRPFLAIEVNGFAYHENMPDRRAKDRLKQSVLDKNGLPLLALPTTGSDEEDKIRAALDEVVSK